MATASANPHVFDATTAGFQDDVLQASLQTPVLVDFWAAWCGPCKSLGPILEKVAAAYNGAFRLAKVDTEAEPQLAGAFQIRSIPTVFLVKDGQIVDGFQGALPEGQIKEFLTTHGIQPLADTEDQPEPEANQPPPDPHAEVVRLRKLVETEPDTAEHRLDLALALLKTGAEQEATSLLEALPANLATDDRAEQAHARLRFLALLRDAPPVEVLEAAVASNSDDLQARHLLGAYAIVGGDPERGLAHFLHMLQADRTWQDGQARKALIDAFRVVEDADLVSKYRRRMSSLLLV